MASAHDIYSDCDYEYDYANGIQSVPNQILPYVNLTKIGDKIDGYYLQNLLHKSTCVYVYTVSVQFGTKIKKDNRFCVNEISTSPLFRGNHSQTMLQSNQVME